MNKFIELCDIEKNIVSGGQEKLYIEELLYFGMTLA